MWWLGHMNGQRRQWRDLRYRSWNMTALYPSVYCTAMMSWKRFTKKCSSPLLVGPPKKRQNSTFRTSAEVTLLSIRAGIALAAVTKACSRKKTSGMLTGTTPSTSERAAPARLVFQPGFCHLFCNYFTTSNFFARISTRLTSKVIWLFMNN